MFFVKVNAKMTAHGNIYQSMKLLFYTLRALGLAPYDFDTKTSKIQMKIKNYLILVTSIVISVLCYWSSLHNFFGKAYDSGVHSSLLDRIWHTTYLLQSIFVTLVIVFNFSRRQNIENFLVILEKFDRSSNSLNFEEKPDTQWCSTLMIFLNLLNLACMIFQTISGFYIFGDDLSVPMAIYKLDAFQLVLFFHLLVATQFIFSVFCIKTRLTVLMMNMK
jgi:hypothetical protein